MMTMSKGALASGQAETYFKEHYSHDDYYSQGQTTVGQWIGKGADALGLTADVSRDDFSALLQGINPRDGQVFIKASTRGDEHRAGWDATFLAPKSASIQALIGNDSRIIAAHKRAVERALIEVEAYAMSRKRGGREYVVSGNVIGACFDHFAARQVDPSNAPDPHLHTHVVLLNATQRPDGEWRSLDPVEIYRAQHFGSAVYRSELARQLQALGYRVEVSKTDGTWELAGYTREQVMAFSNRRQDIERRLAEMGVDNAAAAQKVAHMSRQPKRDFDIDELKADWKLRAVEHGIDTAQIHRLAQVRGGIGVDNRMLAHQAVEFAKAHLTSREAVVDRREIEATALQHEMGKIDLDGVRREMAMQETAQRLIRAQGVDHHHPQGSFTTPEMVALERENIRMLEAGQVQARPIATDAVVRNWGTRTRLSGEQIDAAALMLSSTNWITAIDALAGTGKTTTVGAIRELAEQQGYMVRAFGPTTRSVHELKDAGLGNAQTIAALLHHALPSPDQRELWFIDEHSLMDSVAANRLLKAARELGVERIMLVGDTGQHQAIAAGNPVKQFMDSQMTVAKLETIHRQDTPEMRAAVKAARYTPAQAFDMLQQQRRITEIADRKDRYAAIADQYLKVRQGQRQALVVSPGNDERREINARIRHQLVEHGLVGKGGRNQEILIDRKLTPAQIRTANSYQPGDVILSRGSTQRQRQGLEKNSYVRVETIDRRGNALIVRAPDAKHVEIFPARWGKEDVEVFTAEHRTLAVGDSVQFRRPYKKPSIANGEFAVVTAMNGDGGTFHFDGKKPRDITLPYSRMQHLDYGYCSTSHSSQGATVDTCFFHADSMRSDRLVNRVLQYVGSSRAKSELRIFTDDAEALRRAVVRDPQKSIALEAIKQPPITQKQPQQQRQSPGGLIMRI
jgi:conjugative relaxase-like TrwC/TraI family protein